MHCKNFHSFLVLFVMKIVFCTATMVAAQNLIPDPGFDDSSMPAWPASSSGTHNWTWDTEDIDDSATSGSGRLENLSTSTGSYTVLVGQCIEGIDETALYDIGVMALFPSGQAVTGTVEAYIQFMSYDEPGCSTNLVNEQSAKVYYDQPGTWQLSIKVHIDSFIRLYLDD